MSTILQILTSPRPQSVSRLVAREVVARLQMREPGARIIDRDLAAEPPPHPDLALYNAILTPTVGPEHPDFGLSERYIGELEAADWVVIGTPMNNFTVPSTLKAWIDHIVRIRRTFRSTPEGKIGMLADTPVIVVSAHGGYIGGNPAYQPDFMTPYLKAIFDTIGMPRIEFVHLQGVSRGPEQLEKTLAEAREWIDRRFPLAKADAAG